MIESLQTNERSGTGSLYPSANSVIESCRNADCRLWRGEWGDDFGGIIGLDGLVALRRRDAVDDKSWVSNVEYPILADAGAGVELGLGA